jgi:hypothetical protein
MSTVSGANPGGEFHTTPLKGTHGDDARVSTHQALLSS